MPENDKPLARDSKQSLIEREPEATILYITFPDAKTALDVGRAMVEARVAGCVNVLPQMTSVYVWKGVTEEASEAVMLAKLMSSGVDRAISFIKERHPYETPAILALPVIAGNRAYLDWVRSGTEPG